MDSEKENKMSPLLSENKSCYHDDDDDYDELQVRQQVSHEQKGIKISL